MSQTMTRPAEPTQRVSMVVNVMAAVICIAVSIPLFRHLEDLPRADVTFANETAWDIGVELALANDSRMLIATIEADQTRTVEEIIEPGEVWAFRWKFRGQEVALTKISDGDLRAAGYRVSVPTEVTEELRDEGAPPAP